MAFTKKLLIRKKQIIFLIFQTIAFLNYQLSALDTQSPYGHDILLLVNYNHAYYNSIPFLKKMYTSYFPNIIFYGPEPSPGVELCEHHRGWYSYKAIAQAIEKYPDYNGYLFVHDDCFINFWNFSRFDKEKIWAVSGGWFSTEVPWYWWSKPCGRAAYRKVYAQLPQNYKTMMKNNKVFDKPFRAFSDILYIPKKYSQETIELCRLFAKHKLFLEIAIPTLCFCLENKKNWEPIEGVRLWGKNRNDVKEYYDKKIDYIHPMKFGSDIQLKEFIEHHVNEMLEKQ